MYAKRMIVAVFVPMLLAAMACVCGGGSIPGVGNIEATIEAGGELISTAGAGLETAAVAVETLQVVATDVQIGGSAETSFPLPEGATVMVVSGYQTDSETLIASSTLTFAELKTFYRDAFTAQGLTERTILTVEGDWGFSMVFDGAANGLAIVVQSADLGDGTRSISVTYTSQ